jgi:hypothetical protein
MNYLKSAKIISFVLVLIFSPLLPFENHSSAESSNGLTLVLKDGTEDDWELRNPNGDVLGIVKSRQKETFKIYDNSGNYNGFVYQSGDWVPRDARQKRELQVSPEDVRLYVDMITAAELNAPAPRELKATRKEGDENEWVLRDQNGGNAGTLTKGELNFKFYNESEKFMGYIDTAGNWLPRLGINRREMRVTPEQAQFYLDVLKAVAGIK